MARRGSDYYYDENRRVQRERPKGAGRTLFLWLVDVVMGVITCLAAVALIGGILARVVNPEVTAIFVFAGLFYQVIYLVNLACALWWVVRWRRLFLLSTLMLIVGGSSIGLFYRSDLKRKSTEEVRTREDVTIVSYNVRDFCSDVEGENNYERVAEWLNGLGAHIVCLQEASFSSSRSFGDFKDKLKRLEYGFFTHSSPEGGEEQVGSGYALFSAYPIVRHRVADVDSLNVNGVWADVKMGRDTIRVFNLHLQSTGIKGEGRRVALSNNDAEDTLAHTNLSDVVDKVVDSYRKRAVEVRNIASLVEESRHPVVVCGDFNDTPVSYAYGQFRSAGLVDAFVEKGRGAEYTFNGLFNLFRIDYILPEGEAFEVRSYNSYDLDYSDHKPIVATIRPIRK